MSHSQSSPTVLLASHMTKPIHEHIAQQPPIAKLQPGASAIHESGACDRRSMAS